VPKPGQARFNHVALSVPADLLAEAGRRQIVDFYSEVFGWTEYPTETIDRKQLVLGVYALDQFVFLIADDNPMQAPRMDHFGLGVATEEELDTFYGRCQDYRTRDSRVDLIDKHTTQYPGVALTSFYVGYLLPMMMEIQYFGLEKPST
jgi:hypothetical protein